MTIKIFRHGMEATVKCSCGFRQTASSNTLADAVARTHACPPRTRRSSSRGMRANSSD